MVSIYLTGSVYMAYRKGNEDIERVLKPGVYSLGVLGAIITIMGIYGEITWPLPCSYNILFYDPYLIIGLILIIMAVSIAMKQKLQFTGILALFSGLIERLWVWGKQ